MGNILIPLSVRSLIRRSKGGIRLCRCCIIVVSVRRTLPKERTETSWHDSYNDLTTGNELYRLTSSRRIYRRHLSPTVPTTMKVTTCEVRGARLGRHLILVNIPERASQPIQWSGLTECTAASLRCPSRNNGALIRSRSSRNIRTE